MNKQNRKRIVDTENILMVARWEGPWETGKKDEGIKKYKLLQSSHGDVNREYSQ